MIREFKFFHGITIQSEGIQGIIRTLHAQWTPELVGDLNQVYTIDAEAELTRLMSAQIAEEIDNDMIRPLTDIANYDVENSEQSLLNILTSDTIIETDEEVIRGVERLTRSVNGGDNFNYLDWWMNIGGDRA